MIERYLAQVVEQLSDETRLVRFQTTIEDALDVPGLTDEDRRHRVDAVLAAAARLVAFNVDVSLLLASVVYRAIGRDGDNAEAH